MKVKVAVSLILALLAFVFITQNTETVRVQFLVWSLEMSLVLLVFIMLGSGIIMGWLLSSYSRYASHRRQQKGPGQALNERPAVPRKHDAASPSTQDEISRK